MFPDFTLQQILLRAAAILIIAGVQGFVLTLVAKLLGDRGPEYDGRFTLNPFTHLDAIGSLTLFLFSLGWIKPVNVDPKELRSGHAGAALLAASGIAASLLLALILTTLRPLAFTTLPDSVAFTAIALMNTTIALSLWFAIFNVLPLPPLAVGQYVVGSAPRLKALFHRYAIYIKLALAVIILTGEPLRLLRPVYLALRDLVVGG